IIDSNSGRGCIGRSIVDDRNTSERAAHGRGRTVWGLNPYPIRRVIREAGIEHRKSTIRLLLVELRARRIHADIVEPPDYRARDGERLRLVEMYAVKPYAVSLDQDS